MRTVKRAIIMAAGTGNRLNPITLTIPKPLVEVNGKRMIDTIIDGLLANGITEIHVVVGYLKEQFYCLLEKYPDLHFIDNPYYNECNNIASLYVAREYIDDVIILDGDQLVNDINALSPEFEHSGYNAVWTDEPTKEWLMSLQNGIVCDCSRNGGKCGWKLYSVSRWSREDGEKLRRQLEIEFEKNKNRQIYWDDVPMFCYPEEYKLGIRKMRDGDVVEIDTAKELVEVDPTYQKFLKEKE